MKHYLELVPISAKIHHKQSKMTRICITLAVFLVAVMFGLADMYIQGITRNVIQENGNWHYEINAIDSETAACIAARPEVVEANWQDTVSTSGSSAKVYRIRFSTICNISNKITEIKTQYHIKDEQVTANVPLLSIQGQLAGKTGANQIYQVAFILSIIVMLTCVLMISSSLNSNIVQQTKFFGMLRCLGSTKKQIIRFVRYEGLYWCRTAIPTGLLLSVLVVWILSEVMRLISPHWFSSMPHLGISFLSMVVSTLLGGITVLLAARAPAKRAAKVSPLTAISGDNEPNISFRRSANTRMFNIETALGIHHATAKRRNYLLMTGAFAACITLFLAFSMLVGFMKNALTPPEWTPDLSIVSETNTCSIENSEFEAIRQNKSVKRVYGRMLSYDIPTEINKKSYNSNLISYEDNQFRWAAEYLIAGSIDAVMQQENQVLFVQTGNSDVQVGDNITLFINGEKSMVTVAGILSESSLARVGGTETIFCSENTFSAITGQNAYTVVDVQFYDDASEKDVKEIENLFENGVNYTDSLAQIQQRKNLYGAFSVLVYGFLSIIIAITVFHIMNTIDMGVAAKMKEYGAMRAIGMSNRQLEKMIYSEAETYAVTGVILGCVTGLPIHWGLFVSLITNTWGTAWSIPYAPLALIVGIVLVASFLAVRKPARQLREMSIVENINAQ